MPGATLAFWGGQARDDTTKRHFNGKFQVEIPTNERATIDRLSHLMFGRALQPHEWGELIGAPDGEKLEARALARSVLVQLQPNQQSPLFITLMREAHPGDAQGVDTVTAHLIDGAIKKKPEAFEAIAPRMVGYSARKCHQLGVSTIISEAVGDRYSRGIIGYRYWPKLGFDAAITAKDRSKLGAIAPRFKSANTILELHAMQGGEAAWREAGTGRKMSFDTAPDSPSQKVLLAYLRQKGIVL